MGVLGTKNLRDKEYRKPFSQKKNRSANLINAHFHELQLQLYLSIYILRPDFTSKLVHGLAFGTQKFYIAPYGKINNGLVNQSSKCDVKSGLRVIDYCAFRSQNNSDSSLLTSIRDLII